LAGTLLSPIDSAAQSDVADLAASQSAKTEDQGMVRKLGLALVAAGTLLASAAGFGPSAQAQGGVAAGILTCNVSSGFGFIFGSSRELNCVFSTTGERYVGHINRFGVDIGFTRAAVIVWTVFAPTAKLAPGTLAGHYAGATAGATIGVGVAAHALIGGSRNTITLQPLSIEGNTGLNVAAGIGQMTLRAVR
jgi:hypothetical protein